jgi:hypothetical protein
LLLVAGCKRLFDLLSQLKGLDEKSFWERFVPFLWWAASQVEQEIRSSLSIGECVAGNVQFRHFAG